MTAAESAHPVSGPQLQREQVRVEGDESQGVLAHHDVPIDALLLEDLLTSYGPPRQEIHRILKACTSAFPARRNFLTF